MDKRLVYRGNKILSNLFSKSVHSIRHISRNESEAKAVNRFLKNDRVSEADIDIVKNLANNYQMACTDRFDMSIKKARHYLTSFLGIKKVSKTRNST